MRFDQLIAQKFPGFKKQISTKKYEEEIVRALEDYRREYGLSYEELMGEPWPAFQRFWEQLAKRRELEKKEGERLAKRKR